MTTTVNDCIVDIDAVKKIFEKVEKTDDLSILDTMLHCIKKEKSNKSDAVIATAKSNYLMSKCCDVNISQLFLKETKAVLHDTNICDTTKLLIILLEMQHTINVMLNPFFQKVW